MKFDRFLVVVASLALVWPATAVAAPYTVRPGDTLSKLARDFGTTVSALQQANGLSGTGLQVGQVLQVPGSAPAAQTREVAGVTLQAPGRIRMGDAFVLRLRGEQAAAARVRFPSERTEDVREPAEWLTPLPSGQPGEWVVLGRAVLGKTTPVRYELLAGSEELSGEIVTGPLGQPVQHLNLPPSVSRKLQDPQRAEEERLVEAAYALRTPRAWTQPFAPAVSGRRVSSGFGQPRTYTAGGPVAYHYGMDYSAPAGTPVSAVNDGVVVVAGQYPVRGGLVAVNHGAGLVSLYFHLSKVGVRVGQTVRRGDKVGEVGSTGFSTGPHLHLELRVRGEATDPNLWIGKTWP
ncbi:peptidoglycan DD-metalloendopeptidase family protein [Deinococcus lacus]|uniref:Peptidoglycan DD-metalloendopeptidase family protein n=1 Tax=Deinococcus lacus TaxID=392561 RepID=A0ABW1YCF6_9DEIO